MGRIIGLLICFKNHKTLLIVYKRVTVPIGNTRGVRGSDWAGKGQYFYPIRH